MTLAALAIMTSNAAGQEIPDHELSRMPVRERPHPGYEPIGYQANGIFFYPSLTSSLRYDSNVFATQANKQSDFALILSPTLIATNKAPGIYNLQPDKFAYRLELGADIYRFRRFDSEDRADARAKLKMDWEITHDLTLGANLSIERKHDERGDANLPADAAEPIPYTDLRAQATLTKHFDRFGVEVDASARRLDYESILGISGIPLEQSARNGSIFTAHIRPFYEFSPGYRAFVRLRGNMRDYEAAGALNRDSDGYDVRGGVEFQVTPLISGSVEAGYLSQQYDNPLIRPFDGLSFLGKAQWLVTPLVTVSLMAERGVAETITPDFDARLDTVFGAQVDYEFMRNVVAFASAKRKREDFRGLSIRTDDVMQFTAGVDYLLNRHFSMGLKYEFQDRVSTIPVYTFDRHRVTFNVKAQY